MSAKPASKLRIFELFKLFKQILILPFKPANENRIGQFVWERNPIEARQFAWAMPQEYCKSIFLKIHLVDFHSIGHVLNKYVILYLKKT
jgi:hypothetical protein